MNSQRGMSLLPMSTGVVFRCVRLTTHFQLVPRLRMSGAMPPVLLYILMAWTGKTLRLYLIIDWVNQCLVWGNCI